MDSKKRAAIENLRKNIRTGTASVRTTTSPFGNRNLTFDFGRGRVMSSEDAIASEMFADRWGEKLINKPDREVSAEELLNLTDELIAEIGGEN